MKWIDLIRGWFYAGYWTLETVMKAVRKGWITEEEAKEFQPGPIVPADSELGKALIEETAKAKKRKAGKED